MKKCRFFTNRYKLGQGLKIRQKNVTIVFYGKNYIRMNMNKMGTNDALGGCNHGM